MVHCAVLRRRRAAPWTPPSWPLFPNKALSRARGTVLSRRRVTLPTEVSQNNAVRILFSIKRPPP